MNPAEHSARADAERHGEILGGDVDRHDHAIINKLRTDPISDDELMAELRGMASRTDPPLSAWPLTHGVPPALIEQIADFFDRHEPDEAHGAWTDGESPSVLWGTEAGGV